MRAIKLLSGGAVPALRPLVSSSAAVARRRSSSLLDGGSILGTSSISGDFLKDLHEDLQREQRIRTCGIGETLTNYVHRAELSHMESPEADRQFTEKLGRQIDDLFSRIPLPEDPMRAALARTPEELEEEAATEMLREAVREAYLRKLDAKAAEELRLKRAMRRMQEKGFEVPTEEARRWEPEMSAVANLNAEAVRAAVAAVEEAAKAGQSTEAATPRKAPALEAQIEQLAENLDEGALLEELQAMEQRLEAMKALLRSKNKKCGTSKDKDGPDS